MYAYTKLFNAQLTMLTHMCSYNYNMCTRIALYVLEYWPLYLLYIHTHMCTYTNHCLPDLGKVQDVPHVLNA